MQIDPECLCSSVNAARHGQLTLAPAGPATPWSPGIPYRDTNGGLEMYHGLTVQHGGSRRVFVRYSLCLRTCQPLQRLQRVQADPENIKPQHQDQWTQRFNIYADLKKFT